MGTMHAALPGRPALQLDFSLCLQRGRRCRPRRSCMSCTWTCRCSRRGIASCRRLAGEPGCCAGTMRCILLAEAVAQAVALKETTGCCWQTAPWLAAHWGGRTCLPPQEVSEVLCPRLAEGSAVLAQMSRCACTGSAASGIHLHSCYLQHRERICAPSRHSGQLGSHHEEAESCRDCIMQPLQCRAEDAVRVGQCRHRAASSTEYLARRSTYSCLHAV